MRKFSMFVLFCFIITHLSAQSGIQRVDGSPYPYSSPPDRLYVTSETMSYSQRLSINSMQGILAKTKPEILRDLYGHRALAVKNNITIDQTYLNNYAGLLAHFSGRFAGYILCTSKTSSANVAISLSGILNAVVIPDDIESTAIAAGLTKLLDVRGKDETWLLANYGGQFNKNIASYQNCSDDRGLFLGDYSAFTGAVQFWSENPTSVLANTVYNSLNPYAAIMGWGPGEGNTVEALSRKSLVIHPADWAPNLSVLTNIPIEKFEQKEPVKPYEVVPNVHTVCFVMSDGDNVQWLLGASDDTKNWLNPNRAYANLGWTISPALTELAPPMYQKYIDNTLTSDEGRNYLIAAPSGRGYFNPGLFPNLAAEAVLLNRYMKKADLRIANIIDTDNSARNIVPYLSQSNIDALFYYNYSNYAGISGTISWYKDKPSIAGRYGLWTGETGLINDYTPETLPKVLNSASTNINSPSGYSLIPVIVWSNDVNAVMKCIGQLGPNVRVVAPDEFVWLIKKNLKGLPMGTGNGLKGEYFKGTNFNTLKYSRIDRTIDFDWAAGAPNRDSLGTDEYSVRWTGQIQPLYSEEFTFYATADDGVKLTVNGIVLFDALAASGANTQTGKITLVAGHKYDIKLEYVENTGNSSCSLEWASTSQLRQIVPKIQLYTDPIRPAKTTGLVTAYADINYGGFSGRLKTGDYTLADLANMGIYNDDIASLKVGLGYKVTLYENDHFEGASFDVTADNTDLGDWANKATSLKVKTIGDTNLEGTYFLQNRSSGYNMDVSGGIGGTGDGVNIQQWTVTPNLNQQFKFKHLGDGCYSIIACHSKKSLDVLNHNTSDYANVQQWTYYGIESQQFILIPTGDGYYKIVAKHSGKIIDAASNANTSNVRQMTDKNQILGQWKLNPVPPLKNGSGEGLDAKYYNGVSFNTLRVTKIDTTINFNWGSKAPSSLVNADQYSIRWTGKIQPRTTGTYTFYINSDNGRRLYIDNKLIIDKWISDYGIEYTGTISLVKDQIYDFKMDYFEDAGGASCILEWMSNEQIREVVPKSQLYHEKQPVEKTLAETADVNIFPIPVTNKTMNVSLTGFDENNETILTIYDLLGKPVLKTSVTQSGSVDLKTLPAGAYIVKVSNGNLVIKKSIVVQ